MSNATFTDKQKNLAILIAIGFLYIFSLFLPSYTFYNMIDDMRFKEEVISGFKIDPVFHGAMALVLISGYIRHAALILAFNILALVVCIVVYFLTSMSFHWSGVPFHPTFEYGFFTSMGVIALAITYTSIIASNLNRDKIA